MPYSSSLNYLGGGTGAIIEPNRFDNSNKIRPYEAQKLNKTSKVDSFNKVLNQEKVRNNKNAISPEDKGFKSGKLSGKYSTEASAVKQKIEHAMKAKGETDGTDFALKELSRELEQQILGIMWNLAFSSMDREFEGGIGEELFHKELVNEMVKLADTGEMGDIAQSIYNDLREQAKSNNKNTKIIKN